ncbi:MAG TPA: TraB/GumN family protein [Thermodesulfovibrionales bacterium]|nr:TraB/GumN family protein [Thermodesulfovibrionales bacterium]
MKDRFARSYIIFFTSLFIGLSYCLNVAAAEQKTFLWKVKSETTTVYVLGSIHFMKKDSYPLDRKIEDAFEKSSVLAVEANVNDISKIDIQRVLNAAFYMGDDSLEKHVSGDTYELVKKEFGGLGFPIWIVTKQRPWFLALSYVSLELIRQGYDPSYGLDMHFLSEASGTKTIKELESVDYQINLLSGFSDADQEAFLLYTLKDAKGFDREMDKAVDAWRTGDEERMESLVTGSAMTDSRVSSVYEKLIYDRNKMMASKIEDYLKTDEVHFVVVGAGHLVGRRGVINLLRNKGYSVEQL